MFLSADSGVTWVRFFTLLAFKTLDLAIVDLESLNNFVVLKGMIRNWIFLMVFMLGWSCASPTEELDLYFEADQINELKKLTTFVVEELTRGCDKKQADCLYDYFEQYRDAENDFRITGISQKKQSILLHSLTKSTYKDIWSTCNGKRSFARDSNVTVSSTCINTKGRFANFLIDYSSAIYRLKDYG